MRKMLFFDYRELDGLKGFTRELEQPRKHAANPLFIADEPWENGNMQLYGSIVKAPGRPFQLWYSTIEKPWWIRLAYAESDDGLAWRKPLFDIYKHKGRKTNVVLTDDVHGPAVIYDADDPREDWRYKMIAGTHPSKCICGYRSADGIRWEPVGRGPIMCTPPDCPMGFLREHDGRYVAYHRFLPFSGRRVTRSESWNFRQWTSDPRMVLEPDAGDPPQVQFYGMGATPYGCYEIGTLWMFHTDPKEFGMGHMNGYQEAELTYARSGNGSGYAWHRAAQGAPFIPRGGGKAWDRGNVQCASQPVFLDDEIRYYFMGTTMLHKSHWELDPQTAGLGMASLKPDRFVALCAGRQPAELMTVGFKLASDRLLVNAKTGPKGWVKVELLDPQAKPIKGFTAKDAVAIRGDSTKHAVAWTGAGAAPIGQNVRLRLTAQDARVYSVAVLDPNETPVYHRFAGLK